MNACGDGKGAREGEENRGDGDSHSRGERGNRNREKGASWVLFITGADPASECEALMGGKDDFFYLSDK